MMKELGVIGRQVLLLVILFTGCLAEPGEAPPAPDLESLEVATAPLCSFDGMEYPCEGTNEDHVVLWAGLMCLGGQEEYCEAVRRSVDEDGRLWRSPSQVGVKQGNSSSRDMVMGLLAYLTATKDVETAEKFLGYLERNNYTICPDASDNRCDMHPGVYRTLWGTMSLIWESMGLEPTNPMRNAEVGDDSLILIQVQIAPNGYQKHLAGIHIHIRTLLGKKTSAIRRASELLSDSQPNNPYFKYLAKRINSGKQLTYDQCSGPEVGKKWAWEKEDKEQAYKEKLGHECKFLIDLWKGL